MLFVWSLCFIFLTLNLFMQFATRLVQCTSTSDEAETSMISKLKEEMGFEFTAKLQKMFSDIQVSKDMNIKYAQRLEPHGSKISFSVLVLTSGSWPLKEAPRLTLPEELETLTKRFTDYYLASNKGKKLQWLTQQGVSKGDLLMTGKFATRYTFTASTAQMSILMLFNKRESYCFEDLKALTDLEPGHY